VAGTGIKFQQECTASIPYSDTQGAALAKVCTGLIESGQWAPRHSVCLSSKLALGTAQPYLECCITGEWMCIHCQSPDSPLVVCSPDIPLSHHTVHLSEVHYCVLTVHLTVHLSELHSCVFTKGVYSASDSASE